MSPPGRATYHLEIPPGVMPARVLLTGDPARARRVAESWSAFAALAEHREFSSYAGRYRGTPLGVVSTGIGGPAMAIAVEELARLGATTFLRVGSSGAVAPSVRAGDLVITSASGRFDGASRAYAPPGYPAVANPEIVRALESAATRLRVRFHVGTTASVDTFYLEQGRPGFGGYLPADLRHARERLRRLNFLNVEMETATLLTIAGVYGLRAGAVCAVFGDRRDGTPVPRGEETAIRVANEALAAL